MSNFLFDGLEEPLPAGVNFGSEEHPLIVAWGKGVNSTAMLCGFLERGIAPDLILTADVGRPGQGAEKPESYAFEELFAEWLKRVGFPELIVVRNDGMHGTLEQECLTNGVLPSKVYGWSKCSEKYKTRPQNKYVSTWKPALETWERGGHVCKVIGYDADEPDRASVQEKDYGKGQLYRFWYPLIEWGWGRQDCVEAIKRAGLPVPPKSSCWFCPSSKKHEVIWLKKNHPDLFERAVAMEHAAAGYNEKVQGLGRHWSWEGLVSLPLLEQQELHDPPEISCVCFDGEGEPDDPA